MAKFLPTLDIWELSASQRKRLMPGQWVTAGEGGPRGRFYGEGRSTVVAWVGNARASKDWRGYMQTIRAYAKEASQ